MSQTEFLYVFHDCYSLTSGSFEKKYLSCNVISHYDMCENCERLILQLLLNGIFGGTDIYEGNDGQSDYKILFASFNPYFDSRLRSGTTQLLKIVLQK